MRVLVSVFSIFTSASCISAMEGQQPPMIRDQLVNSSILTYHSAKTPNGAGVLVLPGGGYEYTSMDKEGYQPAAWLNERGYDAWILNYATATTAKAPLYPLPQDQASEAVKQIRATGNVSALGIWGFSAGGHLAATTLTNSSADLDFGILAYPVITFDLQYTHNGSRTNLIGANASQELAWKLSAENRVNNSTPPTFIMHCSDDRSVNVQNTLLFAGAMAKHGRLFQSLILPDGGHGIGLALNDPAHSWTNELERFLKYRK